MFSGGCFLKTEEVRSVSGLGIFKHDTVRIIGLVGDYGQAVDVYKRQGIYRAGIEDLSE